jgi:hypothetical protein
MHYELVIIDVNVADNLSFEDMRVLEHTSEDNPSTEALDIVRRLKHENIIKIIRFDTLSYKVYNNLISMFMFLLEIYRHPVYFFEYYVLLLNFLYLLCIGHAPKNELLDDPFEEAVTSIKLIEY